MYLCVNTPNTLNIERWVKVLFYERKSSNTCPELQAPTTKTRWAKKRDERTKEEDGEDTVFGEYLKLKRKRCHLLAFNRKPQHKQSFRNVPHSLDQNFICSILCVDYNSVNDAGRFIYSCPRFLSSDPISSIVIMCVCNMCTTRYSKVRRHKCTGWSAKLKLWNTCRRRRSYAICMCATPSCCWYYI